MAASPTPGLAGDVRGLATLKAQAASDPQAAIKQVAKQFEALFMRELLKSMREAMPTTGLTDNQGTRLGTEMLDAQLVDQVAGGPGSLSALIARQLQRQMGAANVNAGPAPFKTGVWHGPSPARGLNSGEALGHAPGSLAFVQQHTHVARAASAQSGIPASFMLAQAAHESAWGRKEIRQADGSPSHNLFGIKAGAGWRGPVAEITTTEYVDGQAQKLVQKFRVYASHAESFADYARLLTSSPRYHGVASAPDARGFAQGLQRAGYATDPKYADKLERVINTTVRLQRATG